MAIQHLANAAAEASVAYSLFIECSAPILRFGTLEQARAEPESVASASASLLLQLHFLLVVLCHPTFADWQVKSFHEAMQMLNKLTKVSWLSSFFQTVKNKATTNQPTTTTTTSQQANKPTSQQANKPNNNNNNKKKKKKMKKKKKKNNNKKKRA